MAHPVGGRILVTSLGANTSLGNVVVACAAARAGLTRPASVDREVVDAEEGSVPLNGHPISTVAGFKSEARLLALALPALRDLLEGAGTTALNRTGLFLAL